MEGRKTPVGGNPQQERSHLQGAVRNEDGGFLARAGRIDPSERRPGQRGSETRTQLGTETGSGWKPRRTCTVRATITLNAGRPYSKPSRTCPRSNCSIRQSPTLGKLCCHFPPLVAPSPRFDATSSWENSEVGLSPRVISLRPPARGRGSRAASLASPPQTTRSRESASVKSMSAIRFESTSYTPCSPPIAKP